MYSLIINFLAQLNLPIKIDITYGEIFFILLGFTILLIRNISVNSSEKIYKHLLVPNILFVLYSCLFIYEQNQVNLEAIKMIFKFSEIAIISIIFYIMIKNSILNEKLFLILIPLFGFLKVVYEYYLMGDILYSLHIAGSLIAILYILTINFFELKKTVKCLLILLTILILYIGFSRTGFLILITYYVLIITYKVFKPKKVLGNKTIDVLIKYVYIVVTTVFSYILFKYIIDNISKETASNVERSGMLEISSIILKEHYILGIGPGNFKHYLLNYHNLLPYTSFESIETLQPHNVFIEVFITYGIIGLLLFIYPLIYVLKRFLKSKLHLNQSNSKSDLRNAFTFLGCFSFIIIILSTSVLSGEYRFLFAVSLSYLFIIIDRIEEKK